MNKKTRVNQIIAAITFFFLWSAHPSLTAQQYMELAPVEKNGIWIQPAQGKPARPVWGHVNGIRVGIAPMPGPRGLLRIYTPYLGHEEGKMINFIAFEPVPEGEKRRGFSELEMSRLDQVRGKRFWSANGPDCKEPLPEILPASGIVEQVNGTECLTVYIFSERFNNGARVFSRMRFFENRPYEVELTTNVCADSGGLDKFILTATMGNFARLRTLYLAEGTKSSQDLWPEYRDIHFAPHDFTPVDEMIRDASGGAYFIASPDEKKPQHADYAADTNEHWKYYGGRATQYWYCPDPDPGLTGLVNGRYTYWASQSPIPGGISFENVELNAPFKQGERYIFGVSPVSPAKFIRKIKNEK